MPVDDVIFLVGITVISLTLLAVGYFVGRKITAVVSDQAWEAKLPALLKESREK